MFCKRDVCRVAALVAVFSLTTTLSLSAEGQNDPLASWNPGPAKQAIVNFVRATTEPASREFVPPGERIAVFDQDGTLWVSHPVYAQVAFTFDRVALLAPQHPEWKSTEPFKTVLSGNREAMAKLTSEDIETLVMATHAGMTVDAFQTAVKRWLDQADHPRWKRPYTELVYQPMLEALRFLRANGYRTYIVTGGGQDFVRVYAEKIYGIPPEQIIGSALETEYQYDGKGRGVLMRDPKLLLNDDLSGKSEDIHLFIGRIPRAAFGNSAGDRPMLEYVQGGGGARLMMLVLHDDPEREYAYGPAQGLPDTHVGRFPQELMDHAEQSSWRVISMKKDWIRIFPFER